MNIRVAALLVVILSNIPSMVLGQGFQPRGGRPTGQAANGMARRPAEQPAQARATEAQANSVSQDLLKIYAQTNAANTEAAVTAIARSCAKVIPDGSRSKADRQYASSLLAWALNRRGEMRSEQASELVAAGKIQEAAQLDDLASDDFRTGIEHGPSNWRIHHNYAIALAMKNDFANAIEQLNETIALKPDYPNALFNRGELHFELNDYTRAIRDYSAAIELNASDPQYFNSRGHARFMLESYEDAIVDYRKAAELAGDSAAYQTDLADAYQYLGKWEEAAQSYRAAVAINSHYSRAYQNAAWLMATCPVEKIRNVELAIAAAKKAIDTGIGRTPETLDTLAAATAAAGRFSEAVKILQQGVEMSSDAEERSELASRLSLYKQGRPYRQPEPNSDAVIRTASSTSTR